MTKSALNLALLSSALVMTGCGGGGSASLGITTPPTPPSLTQRSTAATTTATSNAACTSITPFYWEIGDASGSLASGTGGDNSTTPPTSTTAMPIASASKWLFSTYAVEINNGLSSGDIPYLNFQSGYTNFNACTVLTSVNGCLGETGLLGGSTTNGDYISATAGKFFYNGGHMQTLASNIGLGSKYDAGLATAIQSIINIGTPFTYTEPQLAGGAYIVPANYALFLRNMLGGTYSHMLGLLGSNAVCTNPNHCTTALYSPVNQSAPNQSNNIGDEQWHYSLGHWVEDDPVVGDSAFSSPGKFGFYPWIDNTKTYYGILARYDNSIPATPAQAAYITSVYCGRLIRKAWELGQAQ